MNKALKAILALSFVGALGIGTFALIKKFATTDTSENEEDDQSDDSVVENYSNSLKVSDNLSVAWNTSNFLTYDIAVTGVSLKTVVASIISNSVADYQADIKFLNNAATIYDTSDYVETDVSITEGVGSMTFDIVITFLREDCLIPADLAVYFISDQIAIRPGFKIIKSDSIVDALIF